MSQERSNEVNSTLTNILVIVSCRHGQKSTTEYNYLSIQYFALIHLEILRYLSYNTDRYGEESLLFYLGNIDLDIL